MVSLSRAFSWLTAGLPWLEGGARPAAVAPVVEQSPEVAAEYVAARRAGRERQRAGVDRAERGLAPGAIAVGVHGRGTYLGGQHALQVAIPVAVGDRLQRLASSLRDPDGGRALPSPARNRPASRRRLSSRSPSPRSPIRDVVRLGGLDWLATPARARRRRRTQPQHRADEVGDDHGSRWPAACSCPHRDRRLKLHGAGRSPTSGTGRLTLAALVEDLPVFQISAAFRKVDDGTPSDSPRGRSSYARRPSCSANPSVLSRSTCRSLARPWSLVRSSRKNDAHPSRPGVAPRVEEPTRRASESAPACWSV